MRARRLGSTANGIIVSVLVGMLFSVSVVSSPTPASAHGELQLTLLPATSMVVTPDAPTSFSLSITNTGTTPIDSLVLSVRLSASPLRSLTDVSSWFEQESLPSFGDTIARVELEAIGAGQTLRSDVELAVSTSECGDSWNVFGLDVAESNADTSAPRARSAIVWQPTEPPSQARFATIVPLVLPADSSPLLREADITRVTRPGGLLERQLTAASLASAYAVDPRIIASIISPLSNQEGSGFGQTWLTRLRELNRTSFQLQYADADPALQGQVGFSSLVDVSASDEQISDSGGFGDSWSPTMANVFWAEPNTLTAQSLMTILSTPQTETSPFLLLAGSSNLGNPARAHVTTVTSPGETTDALSINSLSLSDTFTSALRSAEVAKTDDEWRASTTLLAAYLAAAAQDGSGVLVGGFSRTLDSGRTDFRTSDTISYLQSLPWAQPASLADVLSEPPVTSTVVDMPASSARISGGVIAFEEFASMNNFAGASSPPEPVLNYASGLTSPQLSVAWTGNPNWDSSLSTFVDTTNAYLRRVHFGVTSNINMVGGQAFIPITVVNEHDVDVSVVVSAVPSNPRLSVGEAQTISVPANSQGTVKIPVAARVGNGDVTLSLSLTTPSGLMLGDSVDIPVSVRADWEGLGLGLIGVTFVLLVSTGIIRTLRRRNRALVSTASNTGGSDQ